MRDNVLHMTKKDLTAILTIRLKNIYNRMPYNSHQLRALVNEIFKVKNSIYPGDFKWDEKSIILITYGDSITVKGEKPLITLNRFLKNYLAEHISHVHILPFFPYSSDDGFSVINYREVNPSLGNWNDIQKIGRSYKLMIDLVINHVSQQSEWFQNYCKEIEPGKSFFIEVDLHVDLSKVIRPRSLPLLSSFNTFSGIKHIWTTFSSDQIDLNFKNPEVLLQMLRIFLFYLLKGARIIRLDAIAFLWKELGTSCMHLNQTHEIVKLLRDIITFIDPTMVLITETNVPDKENLSYFGEGDEANMIYQFSLPPLILHALLTANSSYLNKWASSLPDIPEGCTCLNFTASHDGIGVRPLEGLLHKEEIQELTEIVKGNGGYISSKSNSDRTESPYELNITYFDALKKTRFGEDDLQIDRFLCSQTLMMSLRGIPAFYIHSLLGTHNDHEGVKHTGMFRSINRYKWNAEDLFFKLDHESEHSFILSELLRRISLRQKESSFHPDSPQTVIPFDSDVFVIARGKKGEMIVLANLSLKPKQLYTNDLIPSGQIISDLLGKSYIKDGILFLKPYQICWLKKKAENLSNQPA